MKKLLLVGALLALGATAFGANPTAGTAEGVATAKVDVKAEITDDFFVISDIYGKPIIVDFGKIQKEKKDSAVTFVDYKVTAKEAAVGDAIKFDITLGGKGKDEVTPVTISTNLADKTNGSMTATLGLSSYEGQIDVAKKEYRGRITGTISQDEFSTKPVGIYTGATEIKIVVK